MHLLVVCLFYLAVRCSLSDKVTDDQLWENYKTKFNKTYDNQNDENEARTNFEHNLIVNVNHNMLDEANYTRDVHEYSDLHPAIMMEMLCGTDKPLDADNRTRRNFIVSERLAQDSWDWTEQGKIGSVKNQGGCGCCWAFAAAEALEGAAAIRWNGLWDISEQCLIDCSTSYGNSGCHGGWPDNAFKYMMDNGIPMDYDYSFTGEDQDCKEKTNGYHFRVSSYQDVGPAGDENAVADALSQKGPLSVCITVSEDFMHYSGGIFHDSNCNNQNVNHAVLLVGYGTENGVDFWKIKNSWGPSWGEDGYMRLQRNNNNMCQIAQYASYPELA